MLSQKNADRGIKKYKMQFYRDNYFTQFFFTNKILSSILLSNSLTVQTIWLNYFANTALAEQIFGYSPADTEKESTLLYF